MKYPTIKEVEEASHVQLATWYRFLPSPGSSAIGKDNFKEVMLTEKVVMDKICEKFNRVGGMTPSISKSIGL